MAAETTVSLAGEHWDPQTGQPAILSQNLSASVYFSCHSGASNHRAWESPELLLPSGCSFTGTWIRCPYGTTASCLPGILLQTSNLCYHQNPSIIPACKSPISGPTHWAGSWNVEMDLETLLSPPLVQPSSFLYVVWVCHWTACYDALMVSHQKSFVGFCLSSFSCSLPAEWLGGSLELLQSPCNNESSSDGTSGEGETGLTWGAITRCRRYCWVSSSK